MTAIYGLGQIVPPEDESQIRAFIVDHVDKRMAGCLFPIIIVDDCGWAPRIGLPNEPQNGAVYVGIRWLADHGALPMSAAFRE